MAFSTKRGTTMAEAPDALAAQVAFQKQVRGEDPAGGARVYAPRDSQVGTRYLECTSRAYVRPLVLLPGTSDIYLLSPSDFPALRGIPV